MTGAVIELLGAQAGRDARRTLPGDPSGFSIMGHGGRGGGAPGRGSYPGADSTGCTY